jgi:O-antigen/teichoic acid export membrane protein
MDRRLTETDAPAGAERPPVAGHPVKKSAQQTLTRLVASTAATRIAALTVSLLVGIATARALGPAGRGQLAVSLACISVFSALLSLGLDTAVLRFSSYTPAAYLRSRRISLRHAAFTASTAALVWGLAGTFLAVPLRLGLDLPVFLVTVAICPLALLSTLLGCCEVGAGRPSVHNLVAIGTVVLFGIGVAAAIAAGNASARTFLVTYGLGVAAGCVLFLAVAPTSDGAETGAPDARGYWMFAVRAYLPNVAQFCMLRAQVPVMQVLFGPSVVGIFAVAQPVAETLLILPIAASLVLVPAIADGTARRGTVVRLALRVFALTTVAAILVALTSSVAIEAIYGTEFAPAVAVVWGLLPGTVLFAVARTLQSYLTAIDRPFAAMGAAAAAMAVSITLLAVLPTHVGTAALGLSISAGYVLYSVVVIVTFIRSGDCRRGNGMEYE